MGVHSDADCELIPDWIAKHSLDAVIGYSDSVSVFLTKAGLKVPRDIAFLSLDRGKRLPRLNLFRIRSAADVIGRAALHQLDLFIRIHQQGRPKHQKNLLFVLDEVVGDSLPHKK